MSAQEASAPPATQHSLDNPCASPVDGEQLTQAALRVLTTPNAAEKASLTHQTARLWRDSRLQCSVAADNRPAAPARPARDDAVSITPERILQPVPELVQGPSGHYSCLREPYRVGAIGGAEKDEEPGQGQHPAKQAAPSSRACPH